MRFMFVIWFLCCVSGAVNGQEKKPLIVGQKSLSTNQGQPLTVQLTDLFVEEQSIGGGGDGSGDGGNNDGGNDDDGSDGGDNEGDGNGDDEDDEEDDGDDGDDEDDDDEEDDGDDKDNDDNEEGDGDDKDDKDKDKGKDKDDEDGEGKGDDKDDDKGKDDKDNDKDKDKDRGNDRTASYPAGYTLEVFDGPDFDVSGTTITPHADFTGVLTVDVRVRNPDHASPKYPLKITVLQPENIRPRITGQIPVSISRNQAIRILLSHLLVDDRDNDYPGDFSLQLFPGEHYSLTDDLITPDSDFTGDLFVRVAVHDGKTLSEVYPFRINVIAPANSKPVITGQSGVKIPEQESLEIKFSHLIVQDNDNRYPDDFSLHISEGQNYTLSGKTITPVQDFLGTLTIMITVHDGEVSSDPFAFKVEVIAAGQLEIIAQRKLEMREDSSMLLSLSDLEVNDPDKNYPDGFTLQMIGGENYDLLNGALKPHPDFHGNLTVPVTVSRQGKTSAPFSVLIVVTPVNDPPELLGMPTDPLAATGEGPWHFTPGIEVIDVDDDHLLFAEIGFDSGTYQPGLDHLEIENSESIHAVFDAGSGVLFLLGRAPLHEYQDALRAARYSYSYAADSVKPQPSKRIYLKLNDGKNNSAPYVRMLLFDSDVTLQIPSAFTPNNDQANDTWKITLGEQIEQLDAFIRVYDKNGNMVFETTRLENEWDGHYDGTPLPADVYFYTIEMDLSYKKVNYKGIVSILR